MKLIYYYPQKVIGAPQAISKNLFEAIYKKKDKINHSLKIFYSGKNIGKLEKRFNDCEIITARNIHKVMNDSIIHISVPPLMFPNPKFLLHLLGKIANQKILLNEQSDARVEMKNKMRYRFSYRFDFSYIPHYIFYSPHYIFYPYVLKSVTRVIVNSFKMSELLRTSYSLNNDVVIPNGIENWWFKNGSSSVSLQGDPAIFYHGRLWPEKGVFELIKGFSKHATQRSMLYIAGPGPQENYLRKYCIELGIEKNVKFLGMLEQRTIKSYIENADALIYPSLYEPFSLAILEAFSSANAPVYYSNLAGIDDFVLRDGYNFNSFYPTVENIGNIIETIIEKNYDKKVVHLQRKFAASYTLDKVAEQYIELYNQF